jgi:hypothetical protein
MIVSKRLVPEKPKTAIGYCVVDETQYDAYARGGSVAVDCEEDFSGIDHAINWKSI